jgi:hypothetical protein
MATTTNYGWTTPDDTALVKDGAAAIRSLGTSIDTTTKNLNPSTTLGDIEYRSSTANTNTRLGIGSTGNVLTVAGGVPTWAAPAGGGKLLQAGYSQNTSTYSRSSAGTVDTVSVTITPTSATSTIYVSCSAAVNMYANSASAETKVKITNGTTTRDLHKLTSIYAQTNYAYNLPVGGSLFFTSPSTSATTYTLQYEQINAGSSEFYSPSLTVFEIGA